MKAKYRLKVAAARERQLLREETSSGSSGRVRGGEKHEIYAAAFGGHLFYDLFLQGQGGPWPPQPPRIRYWE